MIKSLALIPLIISQFAVADGKTVVNAAETKSEVTTEGNAVTKVKTKASPGPELTEEQRTQYLEDRRNAAKAAREKLNENED